MKGSDLSYNGITKTNLKNGDIAIKVRFKYEGKNYGVRNFTKLFGCRTEKDAFNKLQEVKILLSKGQNPFDSRSQIIDDLWVERKAKKKWEGGTLRVHNQFYDNWIKKPLGWKKINKISYEDVNAILKELESYSPSHRNKLKSLLNPMFREAQDNKIIIDPFDRVKKHKSAIRESIDERVIDSDLDIAKKLYKSIKSFVPYFEEITEEVRCFYMLLLLTAHRGGELQQLTKEDIYESMIISPAHITKTRKIYKFPVPQECKKYIESVDSGLLFPNMQSSAVSKKFQWILKKSSINFISGKNLSPHDVRRLFMHIVIRNDVNPLFADLCLEHQIQGTMSHYYKFDYNHKVEIFEKYANLIRN